MGADNAPHSVLLVEDDRDYCSLLRQAFAEAGFRTVLADNGEQALQLLRHEPVDLVVSDFIMPEINGLELCRLVNNDVELSRIKVVLYSCNPDVTFRKRARELGALDYLPKTDDTQTLVRQICELAGLAHLQEAVQAPSSGPPKRRDPVREISTLCDNLLDFLRIALLGEPSPTVRLACEAAQRTAADIKREIEELRNEDPRRF